MTNLTLAHDTDMRDSGPGVRHLPSSPKTAGERTHFEAAFAAILLVGGALLVWLAYARRDDEVPPRAWRLVGVVAAAALMSWLLPIMGNGAPARHVNSQLPTPNFQGAALSPLLSRSGVLRWKFAVVAGILRQRRGD
jgi:hypothetical protein